MPCFAGDVRVFEGHAFIVEAAVSLGGRELKPGINVYRFANRIPLLFEGGSDVITRTATKRINWGSYKINQGSDRVSGSGSRVLGSVCRALCLLLDSGLAGFWGGLHCARQDESSSTGVAVTRSPWAVTG
jgi:hypothetical protein